MKCTMDITKPAAAAAAGLVLGSLAGSPATAAPAAAADSDVMGTYTLEAADGETATWNLTPCAEPNTGCVRVFETGNSERAPWTAEARLTVGSWIMFVSQPDAIRCGDGTPVPGVNTYSWDATKLSGSASMLTRGACGTDEAGISIPFLLNKTGMGPEQYPTAPADVEPPLPSPPPVAPVMPPTEGSLPAESPAAEVAPPPVMPAPAGELTEA